MAPRNRDRHGSGIANGVAVDSLTDMLVHGEVSSGLPDRIRLPFAIDPAPLAADLAAFAESDWTSHFVRDNYEGDWSALPLRSAAGETHPKRMIYTGLTDRPHVDTPLLDRAPNFREALARFECPLRSVRLMRLGPGSLIREHFDPDLDAAEGSARLHVPVTSNEGVEFRLNGVPVAMTPGSVWYLRLADPHSVDNHGSTDRIHLVIDAVVNDWLQQMLRKGASAARSGRSAGRGGCRRW